jgi:hypothetical protein
VAHTQRVVSETHPNRAHTEIYRTQFEKYKKIGEFLSTLNR